MLEAFKVLAKIGHGWQADWAMAKIFLTNLRTQVAQNHQKCANWVHLLQQFFSHLALNQIWIKISACNFQHLFITCLRKFDLKIFALTQTRIEISSWNFQHLFITCLCKIDKKILAIFQTACPPRPMLAETLDASSDRICWDILKRKNLVRF